MTLDNGVSKNRFIYIDKMKAIGILLIMIGHAPGLSEIKIFIYAFHVPLFFIISGFLLTDKQLELSLMEKLIKLTKSLLIPYAFFFLVSWLYWCLTKQYANIPILLKEKTWLDALRGIYIGTGSALFVNPALWFFTALFWISLAYHMIFKFISSTKLIFLYSLIFFLICFYLFYEELNHPNLIFLQVITGLVFYSLGFMIKKETTPLRFVKNKIFYLFLSMPLFIYLSLINGSVDLNLLKFGRSEYLYLTVAIFGIFCLFLLVSYFKENKLLVFLSRNSLLIFASHMIIYKLVTAFFQLSTGLRSPYASGIWIFNIIYVAVSLIVIYYISIFINKRFPILVGLKK